MFDPALESFRAHYEERYDEDARLRSGIGRLEFVRVQEIVRPHLPKGSALVLDVGGATGVHAEWLLGEGHTVHLVDALDIHVERARARLGGVDRFRAQVGDARELPVADGSFDVVLLFGPLYHLVNRADRLRVWTEARRAVRPGGVVFGMGISRFASLFDGLAHWMKHLAERWDDAEEREIILQSARTTANEPTLAGLSSHLIAAAARRE